MALRKESDPSLPRAGARWPDNTACWCSMFWVSGMSESDVPAEVPADAEQPPLESYHDAQQALD